MSAFAQVSGQKMEYSDLFSVQSSANGFANVKNSAIISVEAVVYNLEDSDLGTEPDC